MEKKCCENVDFAGDSEAVVASGEADPNVRGDGHDQEHLGHHQDLHRGLRQGPNRQKEGPKNSIEK